MSEFSPLQPPIRKISQMSTTVGGLSKKLNALVRKRVRGTAIVETPEGILLVSSNGDRFSLPGGGAERQETGEAAAIRELKEETGLKAASAQHLFNHVGGIRKRTTGFVRNHHEVFLIEAKGKARPKQEIKAVRYYRMGDEVNLSNSTQKIIQKYLAMKTAPDEA